MANDIGTPSDGTAGNGEVPHKPGRLHMALSPHVHVGTHLEFHHWSSVLPRDTPVVLNIFSCKIGLWFWDTQLLKYQNLQNKDMSQEALIRR